MGAGVVRGGAVVAGAVVGAGVVGSGAVSVEVVSGALRLPPVAVGTAAGDLPSSEIAIAAPVPTTAIRRPSSAGTIQPAVQEWRSETDADARSRGVDRSFGSLRPHSRQYSWFGSTSAEQSGH